MRPIQLVFQLAVVWCITSTAVVAQQPADPWLKKTAIITTPDGAELRVANEVVGRTKHLLVRVKQVQGDWIWVRSGEAVEGWILKSQAVPVDQAEAYFTARIQQNPRDAEAYHRRAVALRETKQLDRAMQDVNQAIQLAPQEAAYFNCRGNIWMAQSQLDRGLADYEQAIRLDPADAFYYGNAGRAWLEKENADKAISHANQAIRLAPQLAWLYRLRREAYEEKGEFLKAYIDYRTALRIDPESEDWMFGLAMFSEGEYLLALVPDAELAAYQPLDADEYSDRAATWSEKRKYALAIADYNEAIRRRPKDSYLHSARGWCGYKQGTYAEALADYDAAIELGPKVAGLFNDRGLVRRGAQDFQGALADFHEALRVNPEFELAMYNRGWTQYQHGQYAASLADYIAARWMPQALTGPEEYFDHGWSLTNHPPGEDLPLEPLDAYVLAFRGDVWNGLDEADKAVADFDRAIQLDPKFGLAIYCRAADHAEKNQFDQAAVQFSEVLKLHPECGPVYHERGLAWKAQGEFAKALDDFQEALRWAPQMMAFHRDCALLLAACPDANIRNGERAVELAQQACELTQWKDVDCLAVLAAAYAENGDFEQAVVWQTKTLELAPKREQPSHQQRLDLFQRGLPYREPQPLTSTTLAQETLVQETPPVAALPPDTQPTAVAALEGVAQQQPSFFVRAACDHVSHTYYESQTLGLRVMSEIDAYVYVVYHQTDGKMYQIFPNSIQTDNHVKGGVEVAIPASDDLFRWEVSAPFGKEIVKVIASRTPLTSLSDAKLRQALFNPVSVDLVKEVRQELDQQPPVQWVETQLEVTTVARPLKLEREPRRFGVFFGVSQYEFDAEIHAASGSGLNLKYAHGDALLMAKALQEVGQVGNARIHVNEQATRANLEQAITQWLPQVSRPGDTVVIFFSGHGAQIPDDNGDEADGLDEVLLPHDVMTGSALVTLLDKKQHGKLDPSLTRRIDEATRLVASDSVRGQEKLVRATAVSDDLFGRWLQALDGRQVIVILDICHSGGFATGEKGSNLDASRLFGFLDGEMTRLKDLGQRETALLAASRAQQASLEGLQVQQGVMTSHLATVLLRASGPVSLQEAYDQTSGGMQKFFASEDFSKLNEQRVAAGKEPLEPHQAYLVNLCSQMPYLRPQ